MEELKQRIFDLILIYYNSIESKCIDSIMEEIEKWDNSCSMANDMKEETIKDLENICECLKKENIKNKKRLDAIDLIMEGYNE